jgi:hypothetical protein
MNVEHVSLGMGGRNYQAGFIIMQWTSLIKVSKLLVKKLLQWPLLSAEHLKLLKGGQGMWIQYKNRNA